MNMTSGMRARVTVVACSRPANIGKFYKLEESGQLSRTAEAAAVEGQYDVWSSAGADEFSALLTGPNTSEALCFGVPPENAERLITAKVHEAAGRPADAAPRANHAFRYPGGRSMMILDYDPTKDRSGFGREERDALLGASRGERSTGAS